MLGGGGVRERGLKDEEQLAFGRFVIRNLLRLEGGGQFVPARQFGKCSKWSYVANRAVVLLH